MPEPDANDKPDAQLSLILRLRQQLEDTRRLCSGLTEEMLAKRVIPDKWSLKELICHLRRVQQVFEGRVEAMLASDNPAIEPYDPDEDTEFEKAAARPAAEIMAGLTSGRERLLSRLHALRPEEWRRKGTHPDFADYDVHFQIEYMMHHEAHHLYQMYQRRAILGKAPQ